MHLDNTLLVLFYKSITQSILLFNLICFHGNLTCNSKKALDRPRKIAQRIIGIALPNMEKLYGEGSLAKIMRIMKDPTHPLFSYFSFNRFGIRLCVPRTKRARFRNSFVPDSIHMFNSKVIRWEVSWR